MNITNKIKYKIYSSKLPLCLSAPGGKLENNWITLTRVEGMLASVATSTLLV